MSELSCSKRWSDIPFAHRQHEHDGHCSLIHGHNWDFEVRFVCNFVDKNGFVMDFGKLKPMKEFLDHFDHALVLKDDDPFLYKLPDEVCRIVQVNDASSEGLAKYLFAEFSLMIDTRESFSNERYRGVEIAEVVVYEDSKNSARFKP